MIRPSVQALAPYVPGEQPKLKRLVKLNANENAYPPSPKVKEALRGFDASLLRRYPDPGCNHLRHLLARRHGCKGENVFVGNGSDEVLRLAVDVFTRNAAPVGVFDPSYSLYPVLAAIREAPLCKVPLPRDDAALAALRVPEPRPDLFCLVNPNAPTGTAFGVEAVRAFARALAPSVLLVDEAYAPFAGRDCVRLAFEERNVVVSRTFSKAWSLAGLRVGVLLGPAALVDALYKVKDSYNVDWLAQTVAEAALSDPDWMLANVRKIAATRDRFAAGLVRKGWDVTPSCTNFVWCKPPADGPSAAELQARVRNRGFLLRRFADSPELADHLRISIGTDAEMDELLELL
ncbi:MAG: aminotransferase class I/II-fold pyridoxal phosphate-dependent enzyme [Kiritimatiellae bacterium]|nr:aminotransferase class I/II-fold pyridoxal phosphate-dependent enzyme [Kiritimatiellia bacterium]